MGAFLPSPTMLRKRFKKYLPTHEAILKSRAIAWFGPSLRHPNLWHLNRRSVAGGVAVGMFAGLIPGSNPVQFFAAAVGSVLFKVNLPVAALVTLYSNPFTIVPLYFCAYKLGQLALLQTGSVPPMDFSPGDAGAMEWMRAAIEWMLSVGKPLLIGLPLLALLLAVTGYFCVNLGWRIYVAWLWRRRRRRKAAS